MLFIDQTTWHKGTEFIIIFKTHKTKSHNIQKMTSFSPAILSRPIICWFKSLAVASKAVYNGIKMLYLKKDMKTGYKKLVSVWVHNERETTNTLK